MKGSPPGYVGYGQGGVLTEAVRKRPYSAIGEMKLAQVARRLHQHYGLETEISNSLYDALTAACLLPDTGARNIDSLLNQQILPVLSQQLLAQQAVHHKPARLRLDWDDEDGIVLEFDEK